MYKCQLKEGGGSPIIKPFAKHCCANKPETNLKQTFGLSEFVIGLSVRHQTFCLTPFHTFSNKMSVLGVSVKYLLSF
ncbi:MAG: hypothetical protein EOO34_00035 [Cyanobacteriota bacterium]|nr:MAG: hypothetical protein EOO34_00035 [Cyanobacteriota bacterium]